MGVTARWWDDHRNIAYYELRGQWTWQEMWQAIYEMREISADQDRVDVIVDVREGGIVPSQALQHMRKMVMTRPPNRGIVVIVGTSRAVRSIVSMARPLLPRTMRFDVVDDVSQALNIVYREQSTRL